MSDSNIYGLVHLQLRISSPLSMSRLGRILGSIIRWLRAVLSSPVTHAIRWERLLGVRLQPLEFSDRPVKDVVILETLSVEKTFELLAKGLIIWPIFIAQVVHVIHVVRELSW